MSKNLNDYVQESVVLDNNFERKFDISTRMISLTEEVGELAHAYLVNENKKSDGSTTTMSENLTNLLHEIFLISAHYEIDLEKEWDVFVKVMPEWAEKRNI